MADVPHILVVDNDPDLREMLSLLLAGFGYRVSVAPDSAAARTVLDGKDVDLLVADEFLAGERGRQLAAYARSCDVPALLMSGHSELKEEFEAERLAFIGKPFRLAQFHAAVRRALAPASGDAGSE